MSVLVVIGICVAIGVLGQIALKKGMEKVGEFSVKDLFSPKIFSTVFEKYVFVGIVLYATGALLWLVVLSQAELSFAYPLLATGYIFIAFSDWYIFSTKLSTFRILGILLISLGTFFILK